MDLTTWMTVFVLSFAISSTTSSSIKTFCVRTCVCTPQEQENWTSDVVCAVTGDNWPGSYPNSASLTIRGHGVKELEKNVFKDARTSRIFEGLTHLQRLTLSGCNITSIHPETFNGFTNLEVLDLSNNNISELTEEQFKGINPTIILKGNDLQKCIELRRNLTKRSGEKIVVVCGIQISEPPTTSWTTKSSPTSSAITSTPLVEKTTASSMPSSATPSKTRTAFEANKVYIMLTVAGVVLGFVTFLGIVVLLMSSSKRFKMRKVARSNSGKANLIPERKSPICRQDYVPVFNNDIGNGHVYEEIA